MIDKNTKIGVVILNYKTYRDTVTCVESILSRSDGLNLEILVVDNCSPNESFEFISDEIANKRYENVSIVKTERNGGYSYGNNYGLSEMQRRNIDYCIVTNNDVIFHEDSVEKMIEPLTTDEKRALVVPKVLDANGEVTSLPTIKRRSVLKWVVGGSDKKIIYCGNEPSNVYSFSGCCFSCNVKLMDRIGMFDDNVFLYCEEAILAKKIADAGYTVYFDPASVVTHYHGVTTGKGSAFVDAEYGKSLLYYLHRYENVKFRLRAVRNLLIVRMRLKAALSKYSDKQKLTEYIKQIKLRYKQIKKS